MNETIREQIMQIRDSGLTNMLDVNTVQVLAFRNNFYELVNFIEEHRHDYFQFIMTGECQDVENRSNECE